MWTNEEANLNMKIVSVNEDHPCGSVSKIEIDAFPDSNAASEIGFEKVTEYSEGEIVNQWAIPVDKYVIAVESDSIYIPYKGEALQVYLDGSYKLKKAPEYKSKPLGRCPEFVDAEYSGSSYLRCVEYTDIKSGKSRLFEYEGVCT